MKGHCGCPEALVADGTGWPDGRITWALMTLPPGVTEDELRRAVSQSLDRWATVCGITHEEVDTVARARILVSVQQIDGPQGILAQTELPQTGTSHVHLWYDSSERWVDGWHPSGGIGLDHVTWHELGHALGLGHAPNGSANVMAPIYNPAVTEAGPWDVAEAQKRYGPPVPAAPKPAPVPTPVPIPVPQPNPSGGFNVGSLFTLLTKLGPILTAIEAIWADPQFQAVLHRLLDLLQQANAAKPVTYSQFAEFVQDAHDHAS